MGTTVNGLNTPGMQAAMMGTVTIKNRNDAKARMAAIRNTSPKKPTKRLNYNHREISGQILRAKKAQSASSVLGRARSKVAVVARCAASGQYDKKEVAAALAHAKRMVRCAQLKVRNLREEEREQSAHHDERNMRAMQKKSEIKRRAAQKEQKIEQKVQIEVSQEIQRAKRKQQEMMQKESLHRTRERGKITEADMKYLQAMSDQGKIPYAGPTGYDSGVMVSLSAEAAALAMTEAEIRAEVERELGAEIGADMGGANMGTADSSGADMGMAMAVSAVAAESVAAVIDVSL